MRLRNYSGGAVLVMLVTLGCGQTSGAAVGNGGGAGGAPDDDASGMSLDFARSGGRLLAMGYSSNEAKVFQYFHDQELGFDCDFVPEATGQLQRCIPRDNVEVVFTDAACSEPASLIWGSGESRSGNAVSGAASGFACPGEPPAHRDAFVVGEQLADGGATDTPLFDLRTGQCQPAIPPGKGGAPLYRLKPLAERELVSGERISVKVGDDLRLTRIVAEDGAELTVGVTLADRTPCELQRDGECVPGPLARSGTMISGLLSPAVDADCTTPAFSVSFPDHCGSPRYGIRDDAVTPTRVLTLVPATAAFYVELATAPRDPGSLVCEPTSSAQGLSGVFAPQQDVTGSFPRAQRVSHGSGPLRVDWFALGDRVLVPVPADYRQTWPGGLPNGGFTTHDGAVCTVWPADDGTLRCATSNENGTPLAELATFPEVELEAM